MTDVTTRELAAMSGVPHSTFGALVNRGHLIALNTPGTGRDRLFGREVAEAFSALVSVGLKPASAGPLASSGRARIVDGQIVISRDAP